MNLKSKCTKHSGPGPSTTRICKRCRTTRLLLTEFPRSPQGFGYRKICSQCHAGTSVIILPKTKLCVECHKHKDLLTEFTIRSTARYGRDYRCRLCRNENQARTYRTNPEMRAAKLKTAAKQSAARTKALLTRTAEELEYHRLANRRWLDKKQAEDFTNLEAWEPVDEPMSPAAHVHTPGLEWNQRRVHRDSAPSA